MAKKRDKRAMEAFYASIGGNTFGEQVKAADALLARYNKQHATGKRKPGRWQIPGSVQSIPEYRKFPGTQ